MIDRSSLNSAVSLSSRSLLLSCAIATWATVPLQAEQKPTGPAALEVEVGRIIQLTLSDKLAVKYARETGILPPRTKIPEGMQISTLATISRRLQNGQYEIEHTRRYKDSDGKPCLLTLTSAVEGKRFAKQVVSKGTALYNSRADQQRSVKPVLEQSGQGLLSLEFSDLKGLELRTWSLKDRTGN